MSKSANNTINCLKKAVMILLNFRHFFLIFFILKTCFVFSQKEANNWYFGTKAGISFNEIFPKPLFDGQIIGEKCVEGTQNGIPYRYYLTEGCSSISDSEGNLVLYTNGVNIWNRNHQKVAPAGGFTATDTTTGLFGSFTTTQTLIVPQPGKSDLFYIFTASPQGVYVKDIYPLGFRYSLCQVLGSSITIKEKNILLNASTTEKVCALKHGNGKDIWVIMHEWNNNIFKAYLVTENGIQNQPVTSEVGTMHTGGTADGNSTGQMKISPDGKSIALSLYKSSLVELFDFDNQSGNITNVNTYNNFSNTSAYGIEFSPNSKYLYAVFNKAIDFFCDNSSSDTYFISQINVENQSSQIIANTSLATSALQLAPDGKIYVAHSSNFYLGVINFPNRAGEACFYVDEGFFLGNRRSSIGLPGFVSSYLYPPDAQIDMPNLFTPNQSDNYNPTFKPLTFKYVDKAYLKIYNRWGKVVFETDNIEKGWDGKDFPTGVYYYSIEYEGINGKKGKLNGWVHLLF